MLDLFSIRRESSIEKEEGFNSVRRKEARPTLGKGTSLFPSPGTPIPPRRVESGNNKIEVHLINIRVKREKRVVNICQ